MSDPRRRLHRSGDCPPAYRSCEAREQNVEFEKLVFQGIGRRFTRPAMRIDRRLSNWSRNELSASASSGAGAVDRRGGPGDRDAPARDLAESIHAHPTLSETIMEANWR
jgi:hypothetical protein